MTGWVYTALTCSYLCWNQDNFLFPSKPLLPFLPPGEEKHLALPGVFRAAPFRSKELLFRKQRSQFTTCLEAVTAVQLLKLSAAPKCSLGFPVECEAASQGGEGTGCWFHSSSGFKANGNPCGGEC